MQTLSQELSGFIRERTFVIWGITALQHTHGYIHANFFRVMKRNKVNVLWLEDEAKNLSNIPKGSIVLFVDIMASHLEFISENFYIGHNSQKMSDFQDFIAEYPGHGLNWSFTSKSATGLIDSMGSIAKFDTTQTRIFQPYGTPIPRESFQKPTKNEGFNKSIENLIGSVWNDDRNQGNAETIAEYANALKTRNLGIRRIELGKLARYKFSEKLEKHLISQSVIAASIHSNYQIKDEYLACRLFKSVSYGRVPVTNQNAFDKIFDYNLVVSSDAEEMIDSYLSLGFMKKFNMALTAQESIYKYTYEAGINRLIRALRQEW